VDYASWLHLKDDLLYIRSAVASHGYMGSELEYHLARLADHAKQALDLLEQSHAWSDESK
jgi:hypothetical protein